MNLQKSLFAFFFCMILAMIFSVSNVKSEYADVVINKYSDAAGVRPVIYPHWFHRIRFRCKVCHSELGFVMRAGANDVQMQDIIDGKFCGMCHNEDIAWGTQHCDRCHSGIPGLKSGIKGGHATTGPGEY